MRQLALLPGLAPIPEDLMRVSFSHNSVCAETARLALEERYGDFLVETDEFSRRTVSFQANKTEVLHGWLKYREGFSAELVELLLGKFGLVSGDTVLDPFAGSCTTLLEAQMCGINGVGIELLPHSHLAWKAKSRAFDYDLAELRQLRELVSRRVPPPSLRRFPHLAITRTAFPEATEADLMAYSSWMETLDLGEDMRTLFKFILMSILESISFTRKDGQYLRWDGRAGKIVGRNKARRERGRKPIRGINKGPLPTVKEAFLETLDKIIHDIALLRRDPPPTSTQQLIKGNTLFMLPTLESDQFDGVITSPPYANRYDYTRTYALELAYLGVDDGIFDLRQGQLSCTVENKPKTSTLRMFYASIGRESDFGRISSVISTNAALNEINMALSERNARGDINNRGVLSMIAQYFSELTFVFAELLRTCRSGAQVAFVNDNVRYAGEVIPVDLLCTDLASAVGFEPVVVYVLPQRKGNSSQQMGKFGREALRKSITIWRKP